MRNVLKETNAEARARPGQCSGGHDAHKARRRRLHARLAYVMRVDNHAKVHPETLVATRKREVCQGRKAPGQYSGVHDAHQTTACALSLRDAR